MRWIVAAMTLALSSSVGAQDQQQFDLVCSGGKAPIRYRVDLARGEACEGPCDRVWKMGPPSSGELRLIERVPAYRGDLEERATVNRATGEYRYRMSMSGRTESEAATCAAAAFSGFPVAKF